MDILTATKHLYAGARSVPWQPNPNAILYKLEKQVDIPEALLPDKNTKEMACYVFKAAGEFAGFFVGMAGMEVHPNKEGDKLVVQVMDKTDADAFDAGKPSDFPDRKGIGRAEYVEEYVPLHRAVDVLRERDSEGWRKEGDIYVRDVPASHGGPGQTLLVPVMMVNCNAHLGVNAMEFVSDPNPDNFDKATMRVSQAYAHQALVDTFGLDGNAIGVPRTLP